MLEQIVEIKALAQTFVEINEGKEFWTFLGGKYITTVVWEVLRPRKEKIACHKLIWTSFVVPKHVIIA